MKCLIKIILILFLTATSQANEDIKKVEDGIKKAAGEIAKTLKIEVVKGSIDKLKILRKNINHLKNKPGKKFLEWRYKKYKK